MGPQTSAAVVTILLLPYLPTSPASLQSRSLTRMKSHQLLVRRFFSRHKTKISRQSGFSMTDGQGMHSSAARGPVARTRRMPGPYATAEEDSMMVQGARILETMAEANGWETKEISVPVGNSTSFRLVEVTNVDDLLDQLMEKGGQALEDDRLPYWIEVWPSALALSEEILKNPLINSETSVMEIGCGLGLCSLTAATKGARVVQSDYIQEALDMADLAWMLNAESMPPTARRPSQQIVDWRCPDPDLQFDVLLASDVAYEERAFEPLIKAFRSLVKVNGKVFLSEPNRLVASSWTKSLGELEKKGLVLTRKFNREVFHGNATHSITIYELTKTLEL
ncbi:hypothetical protein AAMO2058_000905200 [Amorphochlora amoebiformis]